MNISNWIKESAAFQWAETLHRRWGRSFLHLYLYAAVIYLPLIVLRLTNFLDGMWDQDDHLAGAAELRIGRWFWPWLDRMRFGVSLDPLPAIVSIALFVAGVLMILSLMRRKGSTTCSCAAAAADLSDRSGADDEEGSGIECASPEDRTDDADPQPIHLSLTEYVAGVLMLTTPAVLSQLSYSYMSITFGTAFLLAVLAVWVIAVPCAKSAGKAVRTDCSTADGRKQKLPASVSFLRQTCWIAMSSVLVALMMGLYQACLGVLCIAALAYFIFQLDGTCGGKDCCIRRGLRFALRMLLALVIGAVLYEILLQIHLTAMGETLSDYKGAASASLPGMISALPSSIRHCWTAFKAYFIHNLFTFNAFQGEKLFYLLYIVPALGVVLYAAKLLRSGSGAEWKFVLLVLAGLMIPVFANSFFLLATESDTAVQMTGGMSLVIPLLLLAWDHVKLPGTADTAVSDSPVSQDEPRAPKSSECTGSCRTGETKEKISSNEKRPDFNGKLTSWALSAAVSVSGFLLLYGAIGQAGIDQYAMYVGRQATTTLAKSVLNEFAVYGVDYDYNVVLVYGAPADSPTFAVGDLYWEANLYAQYGNWGNDEETNRLCWGHFFDQQMRVSMNYAEDETLHTIMTSNEVAAMTVFPASGSVQNVWGVTVVKVAE